MNTSYPSPKNSIDSATTIAQYISGPYCEPLTIPNATTYWRCTSCTRESIHKADLYCEAFHTEDCEVRRC